MPVEHEIDEARNLVKARIQGPIDPDGLIEYLTSLEQDARLRPGYRAWFDLSEADPGDLGAGFVRRAADVAQRFDERAGGIRIAVLAPGDLVFGLARMYSMMVDTLQREVRVFRDAAEARAWLCVAEPEDGRAA
ncbi:MAG TPA: STAS/SEC14 domain-containing protein [Myxococcota bacterium]|nr:STAS/SEC14 domain-containing protein [Myxococcota bacterium]